VVANDSCLLLPMEWHDLCVCVFVCVCVSVVTFVISTKTAELIKIQSVG